MKTRDDLEEQLNAFDIAERDAALSSLLEDHADALDEEGVNVNMHVHSFFSYNAFGFSPSRVAWEARKAGLYAAGLCDFDVLDGLEEFLAAGQRLGLRVAVNLETRAYLHEYAEVDISSPGEPGVTYIMGGGFPRVPRDGSLEAAGLDGYRQRARSRNVDLVGRINAQLPDIAIDYERDVLPLTPTGAATERHIVRAYVNRSEDAFPNAEATARFWTGVFDKTLEETVELMAERTGFEDAVRAKLVKRGGIGYRQPSEETFPAVDTFIEWVAACDAIPMITWLDGTSGGEKDARELLECMCSKGAAALNIIPDRNWNIENPDTRDIKRRHLSEIVAAADAMDLPINIGTEMNKMGLPFVDDLNGEILRDYRDTFLRGARIMVGQTILARYAGLPYAGTRADRTFPDTKQKNAFFEAVGALPPLRPDGVARLEDLGEEKALDWLRDRVEGP